MNAAPTPAQLEAEMIRVITPTEEEERKLTADVDALLAAANQALAKARLPGKATVQGSVAKGTWLRGGADVDLFLLLDPSLPEDRLEQASLEVGPHVLENSAKKYAQHPYLTGTYRGRTVDLVPAYAVSSASAKMSAVDRTPFHTAWVRKTLDAGSRAQVRLLKAWMKGVGVYGAQTALGGFSGYLVEILIAQFGSFSAVLTWLAGDAQPRRLALGLDEVKDDVAVLIVVDPVDSGRNCAAAVSSDTLQRAVFAASSYRHTATRQFFLPAPARTEPAAKLHDALDQAAATWTGIWMKPQAQRMDIVFPQFQRAARTLQAAMQHAGFGFRNHEVAVSKAEDEVFMQWVSGPILSASRIHRGPASDGTPNAQKFRDKWEGHADAIGPIRTANDGRLEVEVHVRLRTPAQWLKANLATQPLGKHVVDALPGHRIFDDPAAAPPLWAPAVADMVLQRRPWQR